MLIPSSIVFSLSALAVASGFGDFPAKVRIVNAGNVPLLLYWVSHRGELVPQGELRFHGTNEQSTFVDHTFRLVSKETPSVSSDIKIRADGVVHCEALQEDVRCNGEAMQRLDELYGPHDLREDLCDEASRLFYKERPVSVEMRIKAEAEYATAEVSWVHPQGSRHLVGTMTRSKMLQQTTFTGHIFEVALDGATPKLVKIRDSGEVTVQKDGRIEGSALKNFPIVYHGSRWQELQSSHRKTCMLSFLQYPRDQEYFCSARHDYRSSLMSKFDITNEDVFRKHMRSRDVSMEKEILRRPAKYQNFSEFGFTVEPIEAVLLEKLQRHHRENKYTSKPEDLGFDSVALEGRHADSWMNRLPQQMVQEVFVYVRSRIAQWTGVPEQDLRSTSLYGMRMYHEGSVLGMHLDIESTHTLSAILEVARNDPQDTAPWPLKILDHAGHEHTVPDRAGQIILYESATCSHGRPTPFPGREMTNVFVHFAPKGWPERYTSSEPPLTPLYLGHLEEL